MKPFRNRRDPEGKFALTTPQNPNLNTLPHLPAAQVNDQLLEIRRRADAQAADARAAARQNEDRAAARQNEAAAQTSVDATQNAAAHATAAPAATRTSTKAAAATARTSKSRESHTPHVPFAPASSVAPAPASRTPEQLAADADLVASLPFLQKLAASHPDIAADFLNPEPPKSAARNPVAPPEKSKSAQTRPLYKRAAPRSRRRLASRLPERELTSLELHARKCHICNHPSREEIEQDFLHWHRPRTISLDYQLPHYRYVYRHAHATGLYDLRRRQMLCALELIIEQAGNTQPSADAVIRAVRACSRLDEHGLWHDPPAHVIVSSGGQVAIAAQRPTPHPAALTSERVKPAIDIEVLPAPATSGDRDAQGESNRHSCD